MIQDFFKNKAHTGFDFGTTCCKFVKLEKKDHVLELIQKGVEKIPDNLEDSEKIIQIETFLRESDFSADGGVSVNIEDPSLLIRRMDLPRMPERDTRTAIKWNFREYVDGSIDDYIVTYTPIEGLGESLKLPISAYCVSKTAVEARHTLLKSAGLRISFIEPNATAMLAAFDYNVGCEKGKSYVVLDLGDGISNFIVVANSCLLFSRPLGSLSGKKLLEQVAVELAIDREKADQALKNYLTNYSKLKEGGAANDESRISEVVSKFISQLVVDIQRSIDAFCLMFKKDKVDKIYLCGGGVCLPDIVGRLSNGLGIEAEILNPFKKIICPDEVKKMNTAPLYAVAVGLAIPKEKK